MNAEKSVYLVTGFLGSGKTTFINRLIKSGDLERTAIIVNEFGEAGLDHLLIEGGDDTMLELSNGCVCCSMRGALAESLEKVSDLDVDTVVIETTGVADPQSIVQALNTGVSGGDDLKLRGVLVLVDGSDRQAFSARPLEFWKQIAFATRVLVSKLDQVSPDAAIGNYQSICQEIGRFNPGVSVTDLAKTTDLSTLLADTFTEYAIQGDEQHLVPRANEGLHRAHDFLSISVSSQSVVSQANLLSFLDALGQRYGRSMLRVKGLVLLLESPEKPAVVHAVAGIAQELAWLDHWPNDRQTTVLTLISDGADLAEARRLFQTFWGEPQIDTPDREALNNNPLSILGV